MNTEEQLLNKLLEELEKIEDTGSYQYEQGFDSCRSKVMEIIRKLQVEIKAEFSKGDTVVILEKESLYLKTGAIRDISACNGGVFYKVEVDGIVYAFDPPHLKHVLTVK